MAVTGAVQVTAAGRTMAVTGAVPHCRENYGCYWSSSSDSHTAGRTMAVTGAVQVTATLQGEL